MILKNDISNDDTPDNTQQLIAYYTSETPISTQDFRKYLVGKIPSYMVPDAFIHLEELPLTSNGKIDKKSLRENKYLKKEDISNVDFLKLYGINPSKHITGEFNSISHTITSFQYNKLKDLASEMAKGSELSSNVVLNHLFITIYFAFLYRVSKQNRITIGIPFNNFSDTNHNRFVTLTIELGRK